MSATAIRPFCVQCNKTIDGAAIYQGGGAYHMTCFQPSQMQTDADRITPRDKLEWLMLRYRTAQEMAMDARTGHDWQKLVNETADRIEEMLK